MRRKSSNYRNSSPKEKIIPKCEYCRVIENLPINCLMGDIKARKVGRLKANSTKNRKVK